MDADRLLRIAYRLWRVDAGSNSADCAIHQALSCAGPVLKYTTNEVAARSLLPDGFEWIFPVFSDGAFYAACRRSGVAGDQTRSHTGQWGRTVALAMCGAAIRAHVMAQSAGPP